MKPRVVLLLQPRTNLLDLGGVAQVFLEAKAQGLDITVEHCAMGDPIDTSIGLSFTGVSDFRKQRLQRGDHVFVISSDIQYVLSNRFQPSKAQETANTPPPNRASDGQMAAASSRPTAV